MTCTLGQIFTYKYFVYQRNGMIATYPYNGYSSDTHSRTNCAYCIIHEPYLLRFLTYYNKKKEIIKVGSKFEENHKKKESLFLFWLDYYMPIWFFSDTNCINIIEFGNCIVNYQSFIRIHVVQFDSYFCLAHFASNSLSSFL